MLPSPPPLANRPSGSTAGRLAAAMFGTLGSPVKSLGQSDVVVVAAAGQPSVISTAGDRTRCHV